MDPANTDSRLALRNVAQRLGLRSFWQWWIGQLAPLLPAGARNTMRRRRLRPMLAFDSDAAVLSVPAMSNGNVAYKEVARIALTGDPAQVAKAGRAAIDALPSVAYGAPSREARVVVALPPSQVLRKTITLPAAVEENLQQALAYDLDRHTPFKPEEVCFDAVVVARNPAKREIRVDWAAALRSVVDQARRRAESWGAVVLGVTPDTAAGAAAAGGTALNLIGADERADRSTWRRQLWLPLALIAALAIVAVVIPIWQKRSYAIALTQLVEQARLQAEASGALRDQLERLTGDYNFALQKKYAFPSTLQVVEDVTKLLPDDTWLTQFEVKGSKGGKDPRREILIRGESANAGRLVSLLEESKQFEEAAPRSPTTKIQPGPGEIFDLGAQLKPLPTPAMVPADSVTATPRPLPRPETAAAAPRTPPAAAAPAAGPPGAPAAPGSTPPAPAPAPAPTPTAGAPPVAGLPPGAGAAPPAQPPAASAPPAPPSSTHPAGSAGAPAAAMPPPALPPQSAAPAAGGAAAMPVPPKARGGPVQ